MKAIIGLISTIILGAMMILSFVLFDKEIITSGWALLYYNVFCFAGIGIIMDVFERSDED